MTLANFSKTSPSSLVGAFLRAPLHLIPKSTVMSVRSGLNKGMKWIVGSGIHGCWLGHYELEKQQRMREFVKPGMKVFDIGANAGFYTLAFSRLVGDEGHVWAFEPFAENAHNLLQHVRLNDIRNVTVIQAAVSDRAGAAWFSTVFSRSEGAITNRDSGYMVPTLALDALADGGTLPIPDLVKMDVEGAESAVLTGASRLLAHRRSILFVALHGDEQPRRCLQILAQHGYDAFRLTGEKVTGDPSHIEDIYAMPG